MAEVLVAEFAVAGAQSRSSSINIVRCGVSAIKGGALNVAPLHSMIDTLRLV